MCTRGQNERFRTVREGKKQQGEDEEQNVGQLQLEPLSDGMVGQLQFFSINIVVLFSQRCVLYRSQSFCPSIAPIPFVNTPSPRVRAALV